MSGAQQMVTPSRKYIVGDVVELCTGLVCYRYYVIRVRRTQRGFVNDLQKVGAESKCPDPLIAEYDALCKAGESKKRAALLARQKFGGADGALSRSQFYKRLAAR
jgi:hypothetical protein